MEAETSTKHSAANDGNTMLAERFFWRDVREELPEKDTAVLVYQPNEKKEHEQFVCAYDGSNWRHLNDDGDIDSMYEQLTWYDEITHWMPLPDVPSSQK